MSKKNKNKTEKNASKQDDIEAELIALDEDQADANAGMLIDEVDDEMTKEDKSSLSDAQEEEPKKPLVNQKEKKEKRKPRKGLGEELIGVYESTGEDLTSVTMLDHRRRTWQRMLMWILLFLVAVFVGVAGVSWYIWGGQSSFSGELVEFSIQAEEESASGKSVTYQVQYANRESVSFGKSEIELRYPPGFLFDSAQPQPSNADNLWDLGSLSPGAGGLIEVTGRLVGRPDADTTVSGVFRYWPANFSSEFQEVASAQIRVQPAPVSLRVEGPDQILVGQKTSYSLIVKNTGQEQMSGLRLEAVYPESFIAETFTPTPTEENHFWELEPLEPEQEVEIQIDGYFSAAEAEEAELIVGLQQKGKNDDYFTQREERVTTKLVEGDLIANLIANGSSKESSAQWGDAVNVTLSLENSSKTELSDITVVLTAATKYRSRDAEAGSDGAILFNSLVDAANGAVKVVKSDDNKVVHARTITWDQGDLDLLSAMQPGDEGSLNIQFTLVDAAEALERMQYPDDAEVTLSAQIIIAATGGVNEEVTVTSNPVTIKLNTDLGLDAHIRYYDENGDEVGSGPLPPQVGQKTTYRVVWTMSNSIHEAQDIIVSTQLPSNVAWTNSYEVSAGEVEFSSTSQDLTWRLNKMPLDVKEVVLRFDITLTPEETQVNTVAPLTKKITMTATDSVTGGKIIQTVSPLTTGAERDEKAADKGLVVN